MPAMANPTITEKKPRFDWKGVVGFTLFTVSLSVLYGIAHDFVTVNVALDYFTVHHPHLIDSDSPAALALAWGIFATWWVGLIAGTILSAVNAMGKRPPLHWKILRRRLTISLGLLWVTAMAVLGTVYVLAGLVGKRTPTFEHDRRLIAVAMTHGYSYLGATVAAIGIAVWIAFDRAGLHMPPARGDVS